MNTRTLSKSFAGGQVSSEMFGHVDDAHYLNGAARLRNMICKPQGPARSRPGTRYVDKAHDSTNKLRLIPFKFSSTQELQLAFGRATVDARSIGNVRIYSQGSPVLYTFPKNYVPPMNFDTATAGAFVNGVDIAGDQIKFTAAHNLAVGDPIAFTASVGNFIPQPLQVGTVYYAIFIDAVTIRVATTAANALTNTAIDLLTTGTGAAGDRKAHFAYQAGDLTFYVTLGFTALCLKQPYVDHIDHPPSDTDFWYRQPGTAGAVTVNTVTDFIDWGAPHGFIAGNPVSLVATVMPNPLTSGTTYYILNPTANTFQVSASPFGAAINLTTTGTAIIALGNAIFEATHPFADADLFDVTYDQSGDVLSLAHKNYPPTELRRLGATAWSTVTVSTGPSLAAPTLQSISIVFGQGWKVTAVSAVTPAVLTTSTNHQLQSDLDSVLIVDVGTIPNGLYLVTNASANVLSIKGVDDGVAIGSGSTLVGATSRVRPVGLSSDLSNEYVVTTIAPDGTESTQSNSLVAINNLFVTGSKNTLTWTAVPGAARYRVYKKRSGLFGYIGQTTETTTFLDDNISPDLGTAPPIQDVTLTKPGAVGHFEQRRFFAATPEFPQDFYATKSGTESDLGFSLPIQDTDRLRFRISSRQRATIRHIVPMDQLILLTDIAEYRVSAVNADALTPGSVAVRAQSYIGANGVQPVIVNTSCIFCAARGGHMREMGFEVNRQSFVTGDLSLRATDLFDGLSLVDMTFQKSPHPIVWAVSSSGKLLGLTYVPEESIGAWHQHDTGDGTVTDGVFESCSAISEGVEDALYVVVRRFVNGASVRYVEVLAPQAAPASIVDAYCVDAGITYKGTPISTLPGLTHLEGKVVDVLADGVVLSKTVTGGLITLTTAASTVHVGLPFLPDVLTLPVVMQLDALGQGRTKNIDRVWLRVSGTQSFLVGPDALNLVPGDQDAVGLSTRQVEVRIPGSWTDGGQILIQQPDPLPLTVVGLTLEVSIGS